MYVTTRRTKLFTRINKGDVCNHEPQCSRVAKGGLRAAIILCFLFYNFTELKKENHNERKIELINEMYFF